MQDLIRQQVIIEIITMIFAIATAGSSALYAWVVHRHKKDKAEQDAIRDGIMAILHDRIFQAAHHYCDEQGWCSLDDKKNIEYLYKPYAALHGNGTGKTAYEAIMALPTELHNK